jgi:hypothetical protein
MPRASGASFKHSELSMAEAPRNAMVQMAMKPQAKRAERCPAGRWRLAVRGLRPSMSASRTRLKAMATERAATIATTIQSSFQPRPSVEKFASRQARRAPVRANGSANTECSNLIISRVRRRRLKKVAKLLV